MLHSSIIVSRQILLFWVFDNFYLLGAQVVTSFINHFKVSERFVETRSSSSSSSSLSWLLLTLLACSSRYLLFRAQRTRSLIHVRVMCYVVFQNSFLLIRDGTLRINLDIDGTAKSWWDWNDLVVGFIVFNKHHGTWCLVELVKMTIIPIHYLYSFLFPLALQHRCRCCICLLRRKRAAW